MDLLVGKWSLCDYGQIKYACMYNLTVSCFSELGQLSGVAAILRFPMDDEDSDEDD